MKKTTILSFLAFVCLCFVSQPMTIDASEATWQNKSYNAYFNTSVIVSIYTSEPLGELTLVHDAIDDLLAEVHKHSTRHESFLGVNNVKTLNDHPGISHSVDPIIIEMIELSIFYYNHPLSQGKFNVALGKPLAIWSSYRNECLDSYFNPNLTCAIPSLSELEDVATLTDPNEILYDVSENTVTVPIGMELDLGGIAKGYAAQVVHEYLINEGFDTFMVNAGSSNISYFGINPHADRDYYSVGLKNPFNPDGAVYARLKVSSNKHTITSADYERTFTVDGVVYHHLIDPDTLFPSMHIRSVTVITDDGLLGDIYSTLAFILPTEDAIALIDSLEGVEAIWIDAEGIVYFSENLEELYLLELLYANNPDNPLNNDPNGDDSPPLLGDPTGIMPIIVSLLVMFAFIAVGFAFVVVRERKITRVNSNDTSDK